MSAAYFDDDDGFDYEYVPYATPRPDADAEGPGVRAAHHIPEPPRDEGDTPVVPMRAAVVYPEDLDTSHWSPCEQAMWSAYLRRMGRI